MLTFINARNEAIEFKDDTNFRIFKIEGLGGTDVSNHLQKAPYQDGQTYIDSNLEPRPISIEFGIFAKNRENLYQLRRNMGSVLNPKLGEGTLIYEFGGIKRQIKAIIDAGPIFLDGKSNETERFQRGTIDFLCPDPYWKSEQIISEPMTAYRGLFKFPLTFPTQMGEVGSTQIFVNEGDVDTPVQIEFRGPALNPRVTNKTTGEFIQINRELEDGDRLIVDTTFGNKRVEIIRLDGTIENVLNWIDLNSTFWQLIPGPNEIEYTADAGRTNAVVSIKWRNQYLAV